MGKLINKITTAMLRILLHRCKYKLHLYAMEHGDRVVIAMIECCDFLLIELDRLKGIQA